MHANGFIKKIQKTWLSNATTAEKFNLYQEVSITTTKSVNFVISIDLSFTNFWHINIAYLNILHYIKKVNKY